MFSVLILPLIFGVIAGVTSEPCYQKYANCGINLINELGTADRCSFAVSFISCVKSVSEECDTHIVDNLEKLQNLTNYICYPDQSQIEEWKNATMCVLSNLNKFLDCTGKVDTCTAASDRLSCFNSTISQNCGEIGETSAKEVGKILAGLFNECEKLADNGTERCLMKNSDKILSCNLEQVFNTVGDICTYAGNLLSCVTANAEKECGENGKRVVEIYTNDTMFVLEKCKEINIIKDLNVPECEKQVLQCSVGLVNGDKCEDLQTYVNCMSDGLKTKCDPKTNFFYILVLEKYKPKFAAYCNPESAFNKNLAKSYACMNTKYSDVMSPCYQTLLTDILKVKETDKVGYPRCSVNYLSCLSKGYGKECDGNAESTMNELLTPLSQALDDFCRSITGERCNGAAVVMAGTWLLIASLVFLWTQKDE